MKTIKIILFTLILSTFASCVETINIEENKDIITIISIDEIEGGTYKYRVLIKIDDYNFANLYTDSLYQVSDTVKLITTNKN